MKETSDMTELLDIKEAAKRLRDLAKLTAEHSRNWDNFEEIARSMLQQTYDAGRKAVVAS